MSLLSSIFPTNCTSMAAQWRIRVKTIYNTLHEKIKHSSCPLKLVIFGESIFCIESVTVFRLGKRPLTQINSLRVRYVVAIGQAGDKKQKQGWKACKRGIGVALDCCLLSVPAYLPYVVPGQCIWYEINIWLRMNFFAHKPWYHFLWKKR